MPRRAFDIGGISVKPGTRRELGLLITRLVTGAEVTLPLVVFHGRQEGPTTWINAAIHGDEVCGVEIIRRVLADFHPRQIRGTLIAVPIVNVHGFMTRDRYLPDRRDLNRAFPGSPRGSLASQIAHLMMTEVVARCEVGIDLHTGSDHRANLPHVRADLDDPETRKLAEVFGASVMVHAQLRDGSLRQAASDVGARVLVMEGGEAWRWDPMSIASGVSGVRRVLAHIGMIDPDLTMTAGLTPLESRKTSWARARRSGILQVYAPLGAQVATGDLLGEIFDSFGNRLGGVRAQLDGVLIGRSESPLVNRGDAVAHVASIIDPDVTTQMLRSDVEAGHSHLVDGGANGDELLADLLDGEDEH
jgi:predicted deacylase